MGWRKSSDELNAAENSYQEACDKYGEDSPEALVADELAMDAAHRHFGTYGNPNDHYRPRY
ncbi:hypothetical protein ACH4VR_30995 [Streptomyces sp. NPDC020883]|uniref:hypothetical protein n=1 Tax=Streptomyces sp. NPDC020883 TaxID=3365099 RepID=UPI0037B0DC85